MDWREVYYTRKAKGLCVRCGEPAVSGKTRCAKCAKVDAVKNKNYYHAMSDEQKTAKLAQQKKWVADNPDRVAIYRSRRLDYNRRYTMGSDCSNCCRNCVHYVHDYGEHWMCYNENSTHFADYTRNLKSCESFEKKRGCFDYATTDDKK